MSLVIVGAGMAGLLAGNLLSNLKPKIVECQERLPNNHSAVLRFRSSLVGDVLGIPFKRVRVIKASVPWKNPVADAMAYAHKCLGTYRSDRSIPDGTEEVERFIAPSDLIRRMADRVNLVLGEDYSFSKDAYARDGKVISTVPMPILMSRLNYPGSIPEFKYRHGVNIVATVKDCDAYVTLYVPNPTTKFSRVTLTGDELIIEFPDHELDEVDDDRILLLDHAASLLGLRIGDIGDVMITVQKYAKIEPIDDQKRRDMIFWASTVQGRAYSLGRFACWRPGLLLDDLVKDVRIIESWIRSEGSGYEQSIHRVERNHG